ncbi:hypothetical protein ACTA71_002718 [Dictyostelium dimigraforme]
MATPTTFKEYYEFQLKMTQSLAKSERPVITSFPFLGEKTNYSEEFALFCFLGAVGCVPNVGALLSNVVAFIFFPPPPNRNQELWDSIVSSVYNVANNVRSTLNNARVNGMVQSIQTDFEKYYVAKNGYEKNKNAADKNKYLDDYLKQYDDLEDELLRKLTILLNSPDQTKFEEIGAFTILATTHIFVLKEGIRNGKNMGMTDAKIQGYVAIYNSKLPLYYAHVRASYNAGVKVITNIPNLDGQARYKRYLNYRNYCARFVFDYVEVWGCLDDIYPNGVYRENIRYLWDYVGVPVDQSKPMQMYDDCAPNDSYYHPSIATMDKWMNDSGIERYKGDLKSVDVTAGQFFTHGVQSSFLDETKPGSIRPEALVGGPNVYDVKAKKIVIPSGCSQTGYTATSDVLPRNLSIIPNVANNAITFTPHKSWAIQGRAKKFFFLSMEEYVEYTEIKDKTYTGHKLSYVTGKGENNQITQYENFETFHPGSKGVLDSYFFGFQPCNVFNDNYLFGNQATMVNAQKTLGIPVDGVSLARDHVLPTVHSILVTKSKSLPFKFQYYDAKPVTTSYVFGIRYHSTTPVDISVRNADGVTQQLAVTLKPCISDGKGTNEYKTQLATAVNLTDPRLTIVAVNNNIYIHSIILIPSIPAKK